MSSSESYSPEVSSLEHSEGLPELDVVLTVDVATEFIKAVKSAIEENAVSDELVTQFVQYYLAITGSDEDGRSIVEESAYALFALHTIELLPILLDDKGPFMAGSLSSSIHNLADVRIKCMRSVYSSTIRLLSRYESANSSEQYVLPYLIILISKLLPTAVQICEVQDRSTFLQVMYQNAEVALASAVCLFDIIHAMTNGYKFNAPLEDLYAGMRAEEEECEAKIESNTDESDEEDNGNDANDRSKKDDKVKKRKYPLLTLSITQLLVELVESTKNHKEECQKLTRTLWVKYLSQHGRPRLTQTRALGIQRQCIVHVYTKVPRNLLTEMLLAFSKQLVSHIRCCFIGKGQLLFTRNSTKEGKPKSKRTIFDDGGKKKGGKNGLKDDSVQRYRDLCSWVFIGSIELSLVIIKTCNLIHLVHPYVEICFYYNEIIPMSLRFFPCRIKVLTALSNLAEPPENKNALYIPLFHSIIAALIESVKPINSSGADTGSNASRDNIGKWRSRIIAENAEDTLSGTLLSLKALILCPKELSNTLIYRKTVFYETLNLFCANIVPYLYHPSFPELMCKPTHYLKHLILSMKEKENLIGHEYKIHYTPVIKLTYMEMCMVLDELRRAINRHIVLIDTVRTDLRMHTKNMLDGGVPQAIQAIRKRIVDDGFTAKDQPDGLDDRDDDYGYGDNGGRGGRRVQLALPQLLKRYTAIKGERTTVERSDGHGPRKYRALDSSDDLDEPDLDDDSEYDEEESERSRDDPIKYNDMEQEEPELSIGGDIDLDADFNKDVVNELPWSKSK